MPQTKTQTSLFDDTPAQPTRAQIEHAYHNTPFPLMSDAEYDLLPDSEKVGAPPPDDTPQAKHRIPMLSLEKIHTHESLVKFILTCMAELDTNIVPDLHADLKQDGMSGSLTYIDGKFSHALTRGDGETGEIITPSVANLPSVPKTIPISGIFTINGEISLPRSNFEKIKAFQREQNEREYKTPRNATVGLIKDLDPHRAQHAGVEFIAWGVPDTDSWNTKSHETLMQKVSELGFITVGRGITITGATSAEDAADKIFAFFESVLEDRQALNHDIDGIVIKLANPDDQNLLGLRSSTPRWAISLKPPAERSITTLLDIRIQVGSTGAQTPVGVLEPVTIGGVTITTATLHNKDQIEKHDIRIGDRVIIERANDVIPKVIGRSGPHTPMTQAYEFPKTCAICGAPTHKDSETHAVYYCSAPLTCPGTRKARFLRLVGRDIFDIDTLGGETVGQLCDANILIKPADIFTLTQKHDLRNSDILTNWGDGKQKNLENAINTSRNVPLHKFLTSLLINKVGRTASRQLADLYRTLQAFLEDVPKIAAADQETIAKLRTLPEFGEILTNNMIAWFSSEENTQAMHDLIKQINVLDLPKAVIGTLTGENIVFTGKLTLGSRTEMRKKAESLGAKTSDDVSKNTTILVCGENAGSKIKKAEKLIGQKIPIKIITEHEWAKMSA